MTRTRIGTALKLLKKQLEESPSKDLEKAIALLERERDELADMLSHVLLRLKGE